MKATERDTQFWINGMLSSANQILAHLDGVSMEEFLQSDLHKDAVLYQFENLGEAANHVPDEVKQLTTRIPWPQVIGMRNRLVHEYWQTDYLLVWQVYQNEISGLILALEALLERLDQENTTPHSTTTA